MSKLESILNPIISANTNTIRHHHDRSLLIFEYQIIYRLPNHPNSSAKNRQRQLQYVLSTHH